MNEDLINASHKCNTSGNQKLPAWFRQSIPNKIKLLNMRETLGKHSLSTVCLSAHCPNLGKCWENGTATMMILGDICTRACRFCAVSSGIPQPVDSNEPRRVAKAIADLKLNYVVITSVTRDDVLDGGASHFAETVKEIRIISPYTKIELLIPDFKGAISSLKIIASQPPDVVGHNIETTRETFTKVRPQGNYGVSINVLKELKNLMPKVLLKSGFMVGLGESRVEITNTMLDLKTAGCDLITIGQYLAPSKGNRHWPVERFVTPEEFSEIKNEAIGLGFKYVEAGPLVRSSFMAENGYREVSGRINNL